MDTNRGLNSDFLATRDHYHYYLLPATFMGLVGKFVTVLSDLFFSPLSVAFSMSFIPLEKAKFFVPWVK